MTQQLQVAKWLLLLFYRQLSCYTYYYRPLQAKKLVLYDFFLLNPTRGIKSLHTKKNQLVFFHFSTADWPYQGYRICAPAALVDTFKTVFGDVFAARQISLGFNTRRAGDTFLMDPKIKHTNIAPKSPRKETLGLTLRTSCRCCWLFMLLRNNWVNKQQEYAKSKLIICNRPFQLPIIMCQ